jgi:general stress protein 26
MDQEAVFGQSLALLESLHIAYLSTVDAEGYPQTRAVFNLRCRHRFPGLTPLFAGHERDFLLYFTADSSSPKMEEIRAHPAASAYFCRAEDSFGLLLAGLCAVVEDPRIKEACWQEGWERYYPGGRGDPEYGILQLRPRRMKGWFQSRPFALPVGAET